MATLDKVEEVGELVRIFVPLPRGAANRRSFYAFPELLTWMTVDLPNLVPGRLMAVDSPEQQLDFKLLKWNSGAPFRYRQWLFDLSPKQDEVWEFKTIDLRIFGWIYRPNIFIGVFGDYADSYKSGRARKSYDDAVKIVKAKRDRIRLDEPKFARGTFDDLVHI